MTGHLLEIWRSLTDPDALILLLSQVATGWLGYALLAGVVFAETGLLVGLFLPGDSLLFTVGVVAGAGQLNIVPHLPLLVVASIAGRSVRLLPGPSHRSGHLFAARFALVQAGIRRADPALL